MENTVLECPLCCSHNVEIDMYFEGYQWAMECYDCGHSERKDIKDYIMGLFPNWVVEE